MATVAQLEVDIERQAIDTVKLCMDSCSKLNPSIGSNAPFIFTYDSLFDVSNEQANPTGMVFKPDGTKVYVIGSVDQTVYQYSLSPAWDISTASYDSKSYDTSTESGGPQGLFLKSDGTKMYVVTNFFNRVYQYTLSTPWDISTASYDTKSYNPSTQESTLTGISLKSDGTKMYLIGSSTDDVYQYTLGTPYDISTASYDSVSLNSSVEDSDMRDLYFHTDGSKLYLIGKTTDAIYQYNLSSAWDLSSAVYASISFDVSNESGNPQAVAFNSALNKAFALDYTNVEIYEYLIATNECDASEGCYYTYFTCKDLDNYTLTETEYNFCKKGSFVLGARPLLNSFSSQPTKIDSTNFKTVIGNTVINIKDIEYREGEQVLANPDKNIGDYSQLEIAGSRFWPSFLARNPNYKDRICEIYKDYKGSSDGPVLTWRGYIKDIDYVKGGVQIQTRDILWRASERKMPYSIPSSITLDGGINDSVTSIDINEDIGGYDATDNFEPATAEQPRCVKIEDEYVTYTDFTINTNGSTLIGCTRGAYGTTKAAHGDGTEIAQVAVYANDDQATWAACTGRLLDDCLMDLLCFYAEIPVDYIATVDNSITLNGAINDSVTTITLNDVSSLPNGGVLRIGNELILYDGISGSTITNVKRGMYRTTKASHLDAASVLITSVTNTVGNERQGVPQKARFENQYVTLAKVQTLCAGLLLQIWMNEDGEVETAMQVPARSSDYVSFTDDDFVSGSKSYKRNEKSRITRTIVWCNPIDPDPSTSGEDADKGYTIGQEYIDGSAENVKAYGEIITKKIFAEWLYIDSDAQWTASHYWTKYRDGTPLILAGLELKNNSTKVGDLVQITVPDEVDEDGIPVARFYFVVKKDKKGLAVLPMIFEQAGFGNDNYSKIGPKNGVLDSGINDSVVTIDVDISSTTLEFDDFRSGGVQQIYIEDEKITYVTATDQGGDVIRLTGCIREVDGTTKAAHSGGVDVRMLYSALSDEHRIEYGATGSTGDPPNGNLLDGNGDFTETIAGDLIY